MQLLEFLLTEEAQRWHAQVNYEYPILRSVEASPALRAWGEFKRDAISLGRLGELTEKAVKIMDQAGWE